MEDDWDLHAVVRSCCNTTTTSSSTTSSSGGAGVGGGGCSIRSDFGSNQQQLSFSASASSPVFGIDHQRSRTSSNNPPSLFPLPDPFEYRNSSVNGDLNELYLPFFPKSQSIFAPSQSSPLQISTFTISKNPTSHQLLQQQQQLKKSVVSSGSSNSQTPRSKRRKNQLKKICQVPAEALSSDVWAWRKYGQKPIKGSPYPRGYYRCSTSKGCLARKQVERNRSDPGMFIVTYTAEHNHPAPTHRNSLAGSTRNKSLTPQSATGDESNAPSPPKPTCSSPGTSMEDEVLAQQSTNGESREEDKDLMEDEDEVELELGDMSEMEVTDDFFAGLEGLTGDPVTGGCFSDSFPANFGLPWHANNAAAAASSL